ncbi:MAG TPA: BTAD domain-containing putative transcriptional regulator [Gemmatimonadales bacterium]|nr:BTAD domain-containing putative transcriptional regulator [Gemmatimonadales bacterium]
MIELRTLGALDLRGSDRQERRSVLAQPKRLALLIYLALSSHWQRRDSVVALFWPDLDTNHARGALRQALRFIRRELGEELLTGRSEEELGFRAGTLWCDAPALEQACRAGRPAEALQLYRGDFLDGFFVSGASPEFDHWAHATRARLRTLAVEAARSLAERCEAEGDGAAAVGWARRAFGVSPDCEHTLRRLITLLDRLGDRAAAVQFYEDFARRLSTEHGVEPSPETQELMQAIGRRASTRAWPESPELALARAWFSAGWSGTCTRTARAPATSRLVS